MRLKLEASPRLMWGALATAAVLLLGPVPRRFGDSNFLRLRIRGIILDVKDSLGWKGTTRVLDLLLFSQCNSGKVLLKNAFMEQMKCVAEKAFLRGMSSTDDRPFEAKTQVLIGGQIRGLNI
jgi:hypothetical protein